jgi:MFS family permease
MLGFAMLPAFGAPYSLLMSLCTRNIAGGTKRAFAIGALFVGYNVGNIIGPYLVSTLLGSVSLLIATATDLLGLDRWTRKKRRSSTRRLGCPLLSRSLSQWSSLWFFA